MRGKKWGILACLATSSSSCASPGFGELTLAAGRVSRIETAISATVLALAKSGALARTRAASDTNEQPAALFSQRALAPQRASGLSRYGAHGTTVPTTPSQLACSPVEST